MAFRSSGDCFPCYRNSCCYGAIKLRRLAREGGAPWCTLRELRNPSFVFNCCIDVLFCKTRPVLERGVCPRHTIQQPIICFGSSYRLLLLPVVCIGWPIHLPRRIEQKIVSLKTTVQLQLAGG